MGLGMGVRESGMKMGEDGEKDNKVVLLGCEGLSGCKIKTGGRRKEDQ
jgi:hypothetical protein